MQFEERAVGNYRIYAGAMEATGGYVAAVVVKQVKGADGMPEVFRDEAMSGGHRWARPEEALKHAIDKAREVIVGEPGLLTCS